LARARAEEDLEEIWLYIATDNIVAADALLYKPAAKTAVLASNAQPGRTRQAWCGERNAGDECIHAAY
jgi:plasmid stabilization system protein ParE